MPAVKVRCLKCGIYEDNFACPMCDPQPPRSVGATGAAGPAFMAVHPGGGGGGSPVYNPFGGATGAVGQVGAIQAGMAVGESPAPFTNGELTLMRVPYGGYVVRGPHSAHTFDGAPPLFACTTIEDALAFIRLHIKHQNMP